MTARTLTVEHVDPASLLVDINVRTDTSLDRDFLASIRDLGVLVPIVAVRTEHGSLRVRYGHRRTLAAVEAGHDLVPVVITGDEDADEAARIVSQWHENEYRAGLSTADKLAAVEQLSLLGLSPAQIVKRTKARKQEVTQALAAAASTLAKGAAERYDFLTLDQAAAVAEFETDATMVKALVAAAQKGDGEFRHVLQRARDEREEAAQIAELTEQFTTAGVRIIDQPDYNDGTTKALADLTTDDGRDISADEHASCPGHAVYLNRSWRGIQATLICADSKANGHRDRHHGRPATEPMDETAKAERREVIARNKEWKSATVVRQEWIAGFLARKTPPKGAAGYVATELALGSHPIRRAMERAHDLAATLLGGDASHPRQAITNLCASATDARAQVIALAMVLGAVEDSTDVHTWRNPTDVIKRYFTFLAANGYSLCEVEQIAAGTHKKPRRRTTRADAHGTQSARPDAA
jgi:ParB family chromosome partitioning protein